ncbi:hypothetical protein STANM309S_02558 [Streptomyces tanashiensis]
MASTRTLCRSFRGFRSAGPSRQAVPISTVISSGRPAVRRSSASSPAPPSLGVEKRRFAAVRLIFRPAPCEAEFYDAALPQALHDVRARAHIEPGMIPNSP